MSPAPRPTLSAVAICKNEEVDLPGFLANLLPWVDEVVLVDDGSTDRTAAIASEAGPKVRFLEHPMTEDAGFGGQRNFGLDQATGDWVLHMDVDERVPPDLAAEMLEAICSPDRNGFRYYRRNFFLHRPMGWGGWRTWNHPQLARRGSHRFVNRIHEQCIVDGAPSTIGQLRAEMWHLNDDGYSERLRKSFQYCHIEATKLVEAGTKVTPGRILWSPLREFLKIYLARQGFRDGVPGLISAIHSACAAFRAEALAWDQQNPLHRADLERQLQSAWSAQSQVPVSQP